jgi:hypothetical protein
MLRWCVVGIFLGCSAPPAPKTNAAAKPAGDPNTPCFAGKPALRAGDIYKELEQHSSAWYLGLPDDKWPAARSYGTCTVDRGKVIEADGSLVAEISCGVRVARKGITDEIGLQIGARGHAVIEGKEKGLSWAKMTEMRCVSNGPDQVRCQFEQPEGTNTNPTSYVIAGSLGDEEVLVGPAAVAFFREREILEMNVSMWCH